MRLFLESLMDVLDKVLDVGVGLSLVEVEDDGVVLDIEFTSGLLR